MSTKPRPRPRGCVPYVKLIAPALSRRWVPPACSDRERRMPPINPGDIAARAAEVRAEHYAKMGCMPCPKEAAR